MDSGIFWEAKTHDSSHAISWHDVVVPELGNYRVWVHAIGSGLLNEFLDRSKSRVDVRMQFKIAGLEVDAQGEKFLPISNDEKIARLKVASLKKEAPAQGFRCYSDRYSGELRHDAGRSHRSDGAEACRGFVDG